jgi:hypothetical protein
MRPILLFLVRLGRVGGLLLCALGGGAMVLGAVMVARLGPWNGTDLSSPAGFALGLVHLLGGPLLLVPGLPLLVRGAPPDFRLSDDALRALLQEGRPVNLCLECRATVLVAPCDHCHQSSTVFEVRGPVDAENARALLGLEGQRELTR